VADRAKRYALLSRYDQLYKSKFGNVPTYNKWSEQWAADALVDSYGLDFCYDLLSYYFDVAQNPDWKYFSNYAQEISNGRARSLEDMQERKQRRELARKWLSE
jgi:hypothetical protein